MHKFRFLILSLLLAFALTLGACGKPENKIGGHLEKMTEIMNDNMDSPADGINELRTYLHKNLPDMAEQVGKIVVELEGMEKEEDIKERLTQIKENTKESMKAFGEAANKFEEKVKGNPDAAKKLGELAEKWMPLAEQVKGGMMGGM